MGKLDLNNNDEEELFERLNKLERASEYYEIKIEELEERIKKIEQRIKAPKQEPDIHKHCTSSTSSHQSPDKEP